MSRSNRDPERRAPASRAPDRYPDIPYPFTLAGRLNQREVQRDMRTIGPRRNDLSAIDASMSDLIGRASAVIDQLEQGELDIIPGEKELTALAVGSMSNRVTGKRALIVRRFLPGGRYSRPLAELLSVNAELDVQSRSRFDRLRRSAASRGLEILVHERRSRTRLRRAAFATFRDEDDARNYWYLARLLVTNSEVAQWSDSFAEAGVGPVN